MAALQKIRNKGALLMIVVGLALFAFIAEEFFRSIETTSNDSKMQVGEVLGEDLSAQEFQAMVDEAAEIAKLQRGVNSLTDDEMTQLKDQVWNEFVSYKLIEAEAHKAGLTVTDAEVQDVLRKGTNPMLLQTPFVNQQTGRFDVKGLQDFLKQYDELRTGGRQVPAEYVEQYTMLYRLWQYTEKNLRKQLLSSKFQSLMANSFVSNPIAAKMAFNDRNQESELALVAVPYTSVTDKEVTVTDDDLKAKYNEKKEMFRQDIESRDVKYIDVTVTASEKDRNDLTAKMNETYARLQATENPASVVNTSKSVVPYADVPLSANAFPSDIRVQLDSMSAGSTKAPYYYAGDNTMNIIKVLDKTQAPDSILYRMIQVTGQSLDEAHTRADSIYKALESGARFADIAKIYGQTSDSTWMTSRQYEGTVIDVDGAKYLKALNTTAVNGLANVALTQGNLIIQVLDRKAMTTKYNVAVIKCPVQFSTSTYQSALNKLNVFLGKNKTLADIEKNAAREGYTVLEQKNLTSTEHSIGRVGGVKDAMKWVFDEAESGDLSQLYECGSDNDHLLVVAVTGVHEKGYRPWDDAEVKDYLKQLVVNDKKAELIMNRAKAVKNLAQAKAQKGAVEENLTDVTFNNPPFISASGAVEPAISGRAAAMKKGQFSGAVKGNGGVYFFQLNGQKATSEKYDQAAEESNQAQMNLRIMANQLSGDLVREGKVVDHRYRF